MEPAVASLLGAIVGASTTGVLGYLAMRRQARVAREAIEAQLAMSRLERLTRFKLAALDKRLEAHQRAYRLWWDLRWSVSDRKKAWETARRCEDFWCDNCLYLDPVSRESFKRMTILATNFESLPDAKAKQETTACIDRVAEHLVRGVGLAHFEGELKRLEGEEESAKGTGPQMPGGSSR